MKKLILVLMLLAFCFTGYSQDITVTIPNAKLAEYKADILYIFPNTETYDDDANPETSEIAKYTDNQWLKELLTRWVRSQILRGKNARYRDEMGGVDVSDVQ